jgi:hypothetical protein
VKLPEKFYLGFDKYERDIPRAEAAPKLGRMLKAMEFVVVQLLENKVNELTDLKRELLPEEGLAPAPGAGSTPPREGTTGSGRGGRNEPAESVTRHAFDIGFVALEAKFHSFENAIVTTKTQFLIPRSVTVTNEEQQGPSRIDPTAGISQPSPPIAAITPVVPGVADPAVTPPGTIPPLVTQPGVTPPTVAQPGAAQPTPTPAQPLAAALPPPVPRKYIVGDEKLQVSMKIEIVDFPAPTPVATR